MTTARRVRSLRGIFCLTALGSLHFACGEIIGADFDPKTVNPDHFENPGDGDGDGDLGDGDMGGSGDGDGDDPGAGGSGDGDGDDPGTGGSSGSGGNDATGGTDGTGGDATGGAGTGGDGTGGDTGDDACAYDDVDCEFNPVLNEVKGQGAGADFVEIYNAGADPVDLSGCSVTDGTGAPAAGNRSFFPEGTTLEPGDTMIFQDAEEIVCIVPGCLFMAFGVAAGGEDVYLLDPLNSTIDSTSYPDEEGPSGILNGQTWGRYPDGSGPFDGMPTTPDAANSPHN